MRSCILILVVQLFLGKLCFAQKITYSELSKKDNRNINFEIISKYDGNMLVYKNIARQHFITQYDKDLHIIDNKELDFIPDKTFNFDFIPYSKYFLIIYQFQKNNIVYCFGVKINSSAEKISEPVLLDTTNIGYFSDNKIYSTTFSDDKSKILIYKRNVKNDNLTIATKLFDKDLMAADSTREVFEYSKRREFYSDLAVDNYGNLIYVWLNNRHSANENEKAQLFVHQMKADSFVRYVLPVKNKYIDEAYVKIDNLNKNCIINSFYYGKKGGNIEGLYTVIKDLTDQTDVKYSFNDFEDITDLSTGQGKKLNFENLTPQNIILKKNGGFVLLSELFYTETLSSNNLWDRNYYNNFPYYPTSGYFLYNPYYYSYRPWDNLGGNQSKRFYYNDIVAMSIDSTLHKEWNQVINKKQYDVDHDNFLSYSILKSGGEIRFFYIDKDRPRNVISQQSISSVGELKRIATIKGGENSYEFMPRFGRQIGNNQIIIPFIYLNQIGFARIDF